MDPCLLGSAAAGRDWNSPDFFLHSIASLSIGPEGGR